MSFSEAPLNFDEQGRIVISRPINWNYMEDPFDLEVWNKLTSQFWLPEKIPLSSDLKSWHTLTPDEQDVTSKVFAGLAGLDTVQGEIGAPSLMLDAKTQHEVAVYANIAFMESLSGDTELLTDNGWKKISAITKNDCVAQYEPTTNEITFVNPKIVPSHFDKEVYEIVSNNGNGRQVVSGGHRVYYEKFNKKTGEWEPRVKEARKIAKMNFDTETLRMRNTGVAVSDPNSFLTVEDRAKIALALYGKLNIGKKMNASIDNVFVPMTAIFDSDEKSQRFVKLVDMCGWKIVKNRNVKNSFTVDVPSDSFVNNENVDNVFSNFWKLSSFSKEYSEVFVEEIALWDDNCIHNSSGFVFSVQKDVANFIVAVSSLAGYGTTTTARSSEDFIVYVNTANSVEVAMKFNTMRVTSCEPQEMYCVQVPSTYILTRNGESPVITGNCVHAKSYSSTNATFLSSEEIEKYWRWFAENEYNQYKIKRVTEFYYGKDSLMKKAASTILESFLFYSGFYLPLHWASIGKMTNTADLIRLILRDESVHGAYIGYKFQVDFNSRTPEEQEHIKNEVYELLMDLYENEIKYTESIYDVLGLTEDVKKFMHYNGNKALQNLGFEALFDKDETDFSKAILSSLTLNSETHDFFSGAGSSYFMAKTEELSDDDWDF